MRLLKNVFLGRQMADHVWYWDRAEWQPRTSLHVHGCSAWICKPDGSMLDLSSTFLKGVLAWRRSELQEDSEEIKRHSDGGGVMCIHGRVSDEEYERFQR